MVAAVSRLAALLKQATPGDVPLPAAKPDPAKAALIKTLVTPRAPLGAESMPSLAPPLIVPAKGSLVQKETSSQIIDAYRAALELDETAAASVNLRSSTARAVAAEAEDGFRSLSGQPTGRDDAASGIRAQPMPTYALPPPLQAAIGQGLDEAAASKKGLRPVKPTREEPWGILLEAAISARTIAFGLAAFALLLLFVLLVF